MPVSADDFFLSLADVFVILVPGFVFVLCISAIFDVWKQEWLPGTATGIGGTPWIVLLTVSFVLGHFVSQVGSFSEDKYYCHNPDAISSEDPRLRSRSKHILAQRYGVEGVATDNVRNWALQILREEESASNDRIERRDAVRRLFRNLGVVFALAVLLALIPPLASRMDRRDFFRTRVILLAILIPSLLLSVWRWDYQGGKYSEEIFEALIVLAAVQDRNATIVGE